MMPWTVSSPPPRCRNRPPRPVLLSISRAKSKSWLRCVDRKSTRLNSSHGYISYAVFRLKKKNRGGLDVVVHFRRQRLRDPQHQHHHLLHLLLDVLHASRSLSVLCGGGHARARLPAGSHG